MARASAYLETSRHAVFYFRIRVPDSARLLVPHSHIRRTLKTKCRRQAIVRAALMLEKCWICKFYDLAGRVLVCAAAAKERNLNS